MTGAGSEVPDWAPPDFDTSVPHPARVYDFLLGGKDNFEADRVAARAFLAAVPNAGQVCQENRGFLRRAVRYLVGEAGIRQLLDIGTGIPTGGNTHEVAQAIAPDSRIVYADNDPIVLAHARALLTGDERGKTAYVDADLREPERILGDPVLAETFDLGRPIGLMLVAVPHLVPDAYDPYGIVRTLVDALAPGSHLVISHMTGDFAGPGTVAEGLVDYNAKSPTPVTLRTYDEIMPFFDGTELLDPGLVAIDQWRPETPHPPIEGMYGYGGVGRKN
jgi:SAM-dependent methyltransferase